ncbi:MAG: OsmC family protein [Acidimicrobiia bacterium]|nr:OsmC family protein [Acidimicrobiia bacterium]
MTIDEITQPGTADNGIDIDFLRSARDMLTAQPEAAAFEWRVRNTWVNGTHSTSVCRDFHGLAAEQEHRSTFIFDTDHPEIFASADNGATPTEVVLAALAGCLTAGVAAVAQQRDIQLRSVSAEVVATSDVRGVLGIDPDIRNGFSRVDVTYAIDADATDDDIRALVAQSQKRSAVFDIVTNPTNVAVDVR